jgi:hypothetical protein
MLQMARKPFMVPPWGSRRLRVKAENLVFARFRPANGAAQRKTDG